MNFPFHIAKRYLFAKKSHNAINTISLISVIGITVATAALVCALSIFNGFTSLVAKTFVAFDPELQITPAFGKVFNPDNSKIAEVKALPEIDFTSESLEENALIKFGDLQQPILLKGVSPRFRDLANVDTLVLGEGTFMLQEGDLEYGVIGAVLANLIHVGEGFIDPVEIYMPKRDVKVNPANPAAAFDRAFVYISGRFLLNQQKYDEQMLIVSIDLARKLLRYNKEVSSIDIKLKEGADGNDVKDKIRSILGNDYLVKDRFEQQEDLYKMVNLEKWITFLILAIILIIAVFNLVGSLTILIIDKDEDIRILKNMGANNKLITKIFLIEGWLINFVGAIAGLVIGLIISLLQQYFGLLKLGDAPKQFILDAYPVQVELTDIVLIFITVSIIGVLATLYPVNNLRKRLQN